MKTFRILFVFSLLLSAAPLFAQQEAPDCTDIVYLHGGSKLQGRITEYTEGGGLVLRTWSGLNMNVSAGNVKRIVQRCKDGKRLPKAYDFKEHGLYNNTRAGILGGKTYYGPRSTGYTLQHSIGWMLQRRIGAGIGAGVEAFDTEGAEVTTYPVFAEVRGYLLPKNVTPFYSVAAGWGFAGKNGDTQNGLIENWGGGWMSKIQAGYRLGNHVTVHCGISFQKKTRDWQSFWGGDRGKDHILHKRMELAIGILL